MTIFPDHAALDYDDRIVRLVPGYPLSLDLMACMLATRFNGPCRILVPGCGTGAEVLALASLLPHARFTAVEPSPGMLEVARSKLALARMEDRVMFIQGMIDDLPDDRHDAATLSLVLHFLPDNGAKAALLAEIARRLVDNAPLLLFDAVSSNATDNALGLWLQQQGHDEETANAVLKRMNSQWHRPSPERVGQLLAEAGFSAIEPFFQAYGFLGLRAQRRQRR